MTSATPLTSIVDNQGENTLCRALERITANGSELWIATAFFSLDALNLVGENLRTADKVRLLYGAEASPRHRNAILSALRVGSEEDLLDDRRQDPLLQGLHHAKAMIEEGRLEARIYRKQNFHAKLYISHRDGEPPISTILGSSNFTKSGLTQNVELNLKAQEEQTNKLVEWYQQKWEEAEEDDFTDVLAKEIDRHIRLYDPYAIYLKALLAWGDRVQGRAPLKPLKMLELLDPHQVHAYRQALLIVGEHEKEGREPGVMICDGVGLGKSFVALALMEHWLSQGSRVLLIAPKAILKSSWEGYLRRYLGKYSQGYASLHAKPMTWFGFDSESGSEDAEQLREYAEQADVIIVDESHNFRNSATQRYKNLYEVVAPNERGRKKIVLLTATPVNTKYEDLSNQFQLLTHEDGMISGIARLQLNRHARNRDKEAAKKGVAEDQDALFDFESILADQLLGAALESVAIQRSRKTCRELASAAGKNLRFPHRRPPREVRYDLGAGHEALIAEAKLRFEELGKYLALYTKAVTIAAEKEEGVKKDFGQAPQHGLKFSGYLPQLFLKTKTIGNRQAQVEAFLAKMVYVNVMKQLESSTPAFQSIIESLGQGLALRLRHYCGEDPTVQAALQRHEGWIRLPENLQSESDLGEEPEDAAADEASGGETDDFVCREERRAIKRLRALGFSRETHHLDRWRDDILNDLEHLQSVYDKCVSAQREPDAKLEEIVKHVKAERAKGRKVLVFSQSRKTAEYVRAELAKRLYEEVALVNADVGGDTRARILNAFSPKYNDLPRRGKNAEMKPLPELHVLVSTDVLSEGVNLQEAGCILNYDLHWNPTRLIQRIGRVDRRLREEDPDHEFDILNVFPPTAINQVIKLVDTVEQRQRKIGNLLGIDVSFFKATDEEGTLKEFNALYEGGESARERQLIEYVRKITLSPEDQALADSLPMGALGVWEGAPEDGLFALFTMEATEAVGEQDRSEYRSIIGTPVLALMSDGKRSFDAPAILEMLKGTTAGQRSGKVMDVDKLKSQLGSLRASVNQSFKQVNLVAGIQPKLVCWLQLRRDVC